MTIKLDIISLAVDADMNPVVKEFAKDKIVIGRGKNVDLNLDADDISSKHAIIYVNDDGTLEIEDLGSLNGTSVGDKRISPHERFQIGKKDRIMIGDYLIKASFIKDEKESEVEAQDVNENTKKVSKKDTKTQAKQKEDIKEESKPQENEVKLQEEVKEEIKEEETSDNTNVQNEQEKIEDLENSDNAEKISLEEILEDATVLNNEDKNQDEIFPEESIIDDEEATSISNEMIEDLEMENIIGNESLLEESQDESYDNIFELDEDLFDEKNEASSDSKNIIVNEAKESQEEIILDFNEHYGHNITSEIFREKYKNELLVIDNVGYPKDAIKEFEEEIDDIITRATIKGQTNISTVVDIKNVFDKYVIKYSKAKDTLERNIRKVERTILSNEEKERRKEALQENFKLTLSAKKLSERLEIMLNTLKKLNFSSIEIAAFKKSCEDKITNASLSTDMLEDLNELFEEKLTSKHIKWENV